MKVRGIVAAALAFVVMAATGPAHAAAAIQDVVAFNAASGEFPEGLAIDKRGPIYASLINPVAEVRRFAPGGGQEVVAHFAVSGFGPLGLALDAPGHLYVAVASFD